MHDVNGNVIEQGQVSLTHEEVLEPAITQESFVEAFNGSSYQQLYAEFNGNNA